jgi:hypothetical protein
LKRFAVAALFALSVAALTSSFAANESGQEAPKKQKGKKPAAKMTTPSADAEYTRFGIYEATAPRPAAATPIATRLPLAIHPGDRIA